MNKQFQPVVHTRLHDIWNLQTLTLSRFQARRFVFAIRTPDYSAKVFQIFFNQNDGTLNVNFPYIPRSEGIASIARMSPFVDKQDIHLEDRGKVTSKRVKYAHKADGRAHFSQDAKVKTEIIKQSIPLARQDGHIFTLHVQGLSQFEQTRPEKDDGPPTPNRTVLNFKFTNRSHLAYKVVGMWHEVNGFLERSKGSAFGPTVNVENQFGVKSRGFLIGTIIGGPLDNYALLVTCQPHKSLDERLDYELLFLGGFDPPRSALDPYGKAEFLAIHYPASDYDDLAARLGSIDLGRE
jgi:hypothetical protein